jgi:hypothetical protein
VIKWIAVLLQDTSPSLTQLFYLKRHVQNNSKIYRANIEKLESVLKHFLVLQSTKKWKMNYHLYPDDIELLTTQLVPTQYHFYVLAWNSIKMSMEDRPQSASKRVFINTMFNFLYERFHQFAVLDALSDKRSMGSKSSSDVKLGFYGALRSSGVHPRSFFVSHESLQRPDLFFKSISRQLVNFFPN